MGATAYPVYGYARATLDIDIFIRPERLNAERALQALNEFGYDMTDVTVEDLFTKKLLVRQYAVEATIHPFVEAVTFGRVWENKVEAEFGRTAVFFASLDDLIEMKRSTGSPQDLQDLKYLMRLKEKGE